MTDWNSEERGDEGKRGRVSGNATRKEKGSGQAGGWVGTAAPVPEVDDSLLTSQTFILKVRALRRTSDWPVSSRNGLTADLVPAFAPVDADRTSVPPIVTRRLAAETPAAAAEAGAGGAFSLSLKVGTAREVMTCVTEREKNLSMRCGCKGRREI